MHLSRKPAITMLPGGQSLTFNELNDRCGRLVAALQALGLKEGDRIAFLLANQLEYPVVVLSAQNGGFDHLPLNTHSNDEELSQIISQLKPAAIIASDVFTDKAAALSKQLDSSVVRIMTGRALAGWLRFEDLLKAHEPAALETNDYVGGLLLLSGGSTGIPKIVVRPNANKRGTPRNTGAFAVLPLGSDDTVLIPGSPLYHTMPMGWMVSALDAGAHTIIMERFGNGENVLEAIDRFKVTLLPLVPTMMKRLLDLPKECRERYSVASLKAVMHGTMPTAPDVKRRFLQWIPCTWEGYGMTEGFGMCVISPDDWYRTIASVGKPVNGTRVTIRDSEGNKLPIGKVGTVWFARADDARMSYLGQPEETAACYNELGEGTAFDEGYVDSDGNLFLVGRSKNMMIVGGTNVFPARIENTLTVHDAVSDACVVGVEDNEWGQVPVAVVELTPPHTDCAELRATIIQHCRNSLGSLPTPRRLVVVEQIPRTPTGKVRLSDIHALVN